MTRVKIDKYKDAETQIKGLRHRDTKPQRNRDTHRPLVLLNEDVSERPVLQIGHVFELTCVVVIVVNADLVIIETCCYNISCCSRR